MRARLRAVLDTPYVRPSVIIVILILSGLAVVYLFLLIAILYALAVSIGIQNVQILLPNYRSTKIGH